MPEIVTINNLRRFLENTDVRYAPNKNMEGIKSDGAGGYAAGEAGLVPAPSSSSNGKFLRSDGSWTDPFDLKTLESLSTNSIAFHNAYPRCKYLGSSITDAQNTAIQNRTYDDLFIGDYWTINSINWRIVAIDYYYNVGDTNFNKGNIIVMPDTVLYNAQMNATDTTAGAYAGSLMRTQNLNNARTIAQKRIWFAFSKS